MAEVEHKVLLKRLQFVSFKVRFNFFVLLLSESVLFLRFTDFFQVFNCLRVAFKILVQV